MIDRWDARIRRANELTSVYPFAAEALGFYARVAALQRNLYAECENGPAHSTNGSSLRYELDIAAVLPKFPRFLMELERIDQRRFSVWAVAGFVSLVAQCLVLGNKGYAR